MYDELIGELYIVASGVQSKRRRELLEKAADAIKELQEDNAALNGTVSNLIGQIAELSKPRWIPVTERLPEDCECVLCWYEYYHWSKKKILPEYGIGYIIDGRWGGEVTNGKDCKVLAWMPLPEPPEEG